MFSCLDFACSCRYVDTLGVGCFLFRYRDVDVFKFRLRESYAFMFRFWELDAIMFRLRDADDAHKKVLLNLVM